MIIDAHSHVQDPLDLKSLDEAGVHRAVLFMSRPHPERATDLAGLRREMAVLQASLSGTNTDYSGVWQQLDAALAAHPDRYIGFGSVRLDLPPAAIADAVEREVVGRKLHGIGELTPPPDRADLLEPVLAAAHEHGDLPVVVHGAAPTTAADLRTLHVLAARFPHTPLIVSQLGGVHWMDAIELVRDSPSMYLELSTAPIVFAVRLAIAELPDRTLFGSDAPYGDPVLARALVERVTEPGEVRDAVLGETFVQLSGFTS